MFTFPLSKKRLWIKRKKERFVIAASFPTVLLRLHLRVAASWFTCSTNSQRSEYTTIDKTICDKQRSKRSLNPFKPVDSRCLPSGATRNPRVVMLNLNAAQSRRQSRQNGRLLFVFIGYFFTPVSSSYRSEARPPFWACKACACLCSPERTPQQLRYIAGM